MVRRSNLRQYNVFFRMLHLLVFHEMFNLLIRQNNFQTCDFSCISSGIQITLATLEDRTQRKLVVKILSKTSSKCQYVILPHREVLVSTGGVPQIPICQLLQCIDYFCINWSYISSNLLTGLQYNFHRGQISGSPEIHRVQDPLSPSEWLGPLVITLPDGRWNECASWDQVKQII